jgi:Xaa-Pro aminopeptidase
MPPPADQLARRLVRVRAAVPAAGLDALVVTGLSNLSYVTGLRMSAGIMVVDADAAWLLADGRYAAEAGVAARALPATHLVGLAPGQSYEEAVGALIRQRGWAAVGLEAGHLTVARAAAIRRATGPDPALQWIDTDGVIETLRMVKDPWEVAVLREAGARLSDVATCILPKVSAGLTERQVAWEIDVALHSAGFERPAFETIVASGPHAARPHHRPTARRLAAGELALLDFGGVLDGYAVDLSRTVAVGQVDDRRRHWLAAVAAAQAAAIGAAAPGRLPSEVDAAARRVLAAEGLGEYFVHSTGHGLGLDVHERPTIGARGDVTGPLSAGVVFTVEPGVYLPDEGGVRIEDDVLVTATGAERLTF